MCNLDDVTWGNRPTISKMNVFVDHAKGQEIMKQSYRRTRTNIVIGWVTVNIAIIYIIDGLVLSALHNGNE
jgi:hypothetical protein